MHTFEQLMTMKQALSLSPENFFEHVKKVLNVNQKGDTYFWTTYLDPFREKPHTLAELHKEVDDYRLFYTESTENVMAIMSPEEAELYLAEHSTPNNGTYNANEY